MTPEEISAHQHKASAKAKATGKNKTRIPGRPSHLTNWDHYQIKARARADVKAILKIMENDGTLPDDPVAREALEMTLRLMREEGPKAFRLKAARTLLEYRLAKPTAKQDITVRSAEDWLADLARQEDNESPDD